VKNTSRMAIAVAAVSIAFASVLGTGAANAAPSPTPKPSAKPTVKPTPKPIPKKPFRVGWSNMNEGSVPYPGMTDGFQAAVQYVNKTGGINGRILEIATTCYVGSSPESNQKCGNQFANDKTLNMGLFGIGLFAAPFWESLRASGLPMMDVIPTTPADFNAANTVEYQSGAAGASYAYADIAKKMGAKSLVLLFPDTASGRSTADGVDRYLAPGITLTKTFVPATYTDALPYLIQSGASRADAIGIGLSSTCLPMVKAMKQIGIPSSKLITSAACASSTSINSDPSLWQGAKTSGYIEEAAMGKGVSKDLDIFLDNYPKYAGMSQANGIPATAANGWAAVLGLQAALKGKSDVVLNSRPALIAALKAFKGPLPMGPATEKCGGYPEFGPALCTIEGVYSQVQGTKLIPYNA
jgi:ABC-type branched-subunit amino acid transport system substrate-binding protein